MKTFNLEADVAGATSLTLDGDPVTLPKLVAQTVDHTYKLVAANEGGSVEASLFVPMPVVIVPTSGKLQYTGYYSTTEGITDGTSLWIGKHCQYCVDQENAVLYYRGGDGDFRLKENNFAQTQSLNAVFAMRFPDGLVEQLSNEHGNPADGVVPAYDDGCTWGFNTQDRKLYSLPGYQAVPGSNQQSDPYGIMVWDAVTRFDPTARKWEMVVPSIAGRWFQEHWGGCFDSTRNAFWIVGVPGDSDLGIKAFDCATKVFSIAGMPGPAEVLPYPNIGRQLLMATWCQRHNPVEDEIIAFDGYRGYVIGVSLKKWQSRVIAKVPALVSPPGYDPIAAIETGFCVSIKRQKAFISYSAQNIYVEGGVGGIWVVDLATGETDHADYPEMGGVLPEDQQWTACEFIDKYGYLILANNIVDGTRVCGKRFLRYEFKA